MAILMSKKLLKKDLDGEIKLSKNIKTLSNHIINSQDYEIEFMKNTIEMKYKNYVKQDV
jgi:uncharacterized protein (DUF305 family)